MAHLKRLRAPKFWRIKRKESKWVVRPRAGAHKLLESIPLLILIRDILALADNAKEAKTIIKAREVLVDGKARRDHKYPVGLMDIVSIPKIDKHYRIIPSKKGLEVIEVPKKEANRKICRIENKTIVKGGYVQLNCHDGRNVLINGKEYKKEKYKTGDSLLIELPSQKVLEHLKLDKGSLVLITKGKNAGQLAKVKKLSASTAKERAKVTCRIENKVVDIDKAFVFVVGKEKPLVKVSTITVKEK